MPGRLQSRRGFVTLIALLVGLSILQAPVQAVSPDVVISQVYGGGGNTGATYTHDFVELFNRGTESVSLTGMSVQYASATGTGNFAANSPVSLSGSLAPGRYYLVQMAAGAGGTTPLPTPDATGNIVMSASSGKVIVAGTTTGLACNGGSTPCSAGQLASIVDLVGYGGANFFEGSAAAPTLTNTTAAFRAGAGCIDTDDNAADFAGLAPNPRNAAALSAPCAGSGRAVISQIYGGGGNSGATLTHDFIELFNAGDADMDLTGWSVQYSPATGTTWSSTPLAGSISAGGYYLVQQAAGTGGTTALPTPDATGSIAMSATAGKVRLVNADPAVVDLVGYGTTANQFEGSGPAPAPSNTAAILRAGGGATDTDDNAADFAVGDPNPRNSGFTPPPPPPPITCDDPATHEIADVQGSAAATLLGGQSVRVEGVVTGDFQGTNQLGGFFIQDDTPDADPTTSEGLFVFTSLPAAAGDRVFVSGIAEESFNLTQVAATAVNVCGTGTIAPDSYDLPRPAGTTFEPVEGVLLTFPEALSATEHFRLGRFGELTVSSDGRLFQPTDRLAPGPDAAAMQELSTRRRLLIDDASNVQNPSAVPFVPPAAADAVRIGDTAAGITGVMSFGFSSYRLQPTAPIEFARTNPRPPAPAPVGGDIRVASFNTLNYFTTLTTENSNARGANSPAEFARQQIKEVAAITGLDADVIGLMEVENNGATAISSLVDSLNAATAPDTYSYITEPVLNAPNQFGGTFGTDAIKVAYIYRPAAVTPVGPAQTSAAAIFDRPPLIQTFRLTGGSEPFTVAVNHFKSKNCGGSTGLDQDQGDGQSCFNARRVEQATTLANVLELFDAPNPLIIGDLNSYTEEDPIHVLETAGYTGLSEEFITEDDRYSFVFDGFSGELDHAMASPEILDDVTGATIWHINADEPLILDYNLDFGRSPALFENNAFRSSDHDPLVLGLDLAEAPAAPAVSAVAGWGAATVSWTPPGDGGSAITAYEVTAVDDAGIVVGQVTLGSTARSHTFGSLENGVTHTFFVTALNDVGAGKAGSATATPFVPRKYKDLDIFVDCPLFNIRNRNAFPVGVEWTTSRRESGTDVIPAATTKAIEVPLAPAGSTVLFLSAGGQAQDSAAARC